MRKIKPIYLIVGSCFIIFIFVIAYWTFIPRSAILNIPGEGIYTGQLKGMTFHGYGIYESYVVSGTSYEGEWKNGVFHGQGTLTFANDSKLVGEFVEGSIQGIGYSICPEGHITEYNFNEGNHISGSSDCGHDR